MPEKHPYKWLRSETIRAVRLLTPFSPAFSRLKNSKTQSCGGVFIETTQAFAVGSFVEFDFEMPGGAGAYQGRGRVDWKEERGSSDYPKGIGLQLLEVVAMQPATLNSGPVISPKPAVPASQAAPASAPKVAPAAPQAAPAPAPVPKAAPAPAPKAAPAPAPAHVPPPAAKGAPEPLIPVPTMAEVSEFLTSLVGKTVEVTAGEAWPYNPERFCAVAVFISDENKPLVVLTADLVFASNIGAALTLIPPEVAKESQGTGLLADDLAENFREVINICTTLFHGPHVPHLKLSGVFLKAGEVSDEVKKIIAKPSLRGDYSANIPQYNGGKLALLMA